MYLFTCCTYVPMYLCTYSLAVPMYLCTYSSMYLLVLRDGCKSTICATIRHISQAVESVILPMYPSMYLYFDMGANPLSALLLDTYRKQSRVSFYLLYLFNCCTYVPIYVLVLRHGCKSTICSIIRHTSQAVESVIPLTVLITLLYLFTCCPYVPAVPMYLYFDMGSNPLLYLFTCCPYVLVLRHGFKSTTISIYKINYSPLLSIITTSRSLP
jgi:hypothetical protein